MSATDLDALYEAYKSAAPPDKEYALNKLTHSLFQNAYGIVWHRLKEVNREVVSISVTQAVRYVDQFRGESRFSTWFFRIVVNNCNSVIRGRIEKPEISLEELSEPEYQQLKAQERSSAPLDLAAIKSDLSSDQQQLLDLKLEGKTFKEIASVLRVTPKAAERRWQRLQRRLRGKAETQRDTP